MSGTGCSYRIQDHTDWTDCGELDRSTLSKHWLKAQEFLNHAHATLTSESSGNSR